IILLRVGFRYLTPLFEFGEVGKPQVGKLVKIFTRKKQARGLFSLLHRARISIGPISDPLVRPGLGPQKSVTLRLCRLRKAVHQPGLFDRPVALLLVATNYAEALAPFTTARQTFRLSRSRRIHQPKVITVVEQQPRIAR